MYIHVCNHNQTCAYIYKCIIYISICIYIHIRICIPIPFYICIYILNPKPCQSAIAETGILAKVCPRVSAETLNPSRKTFELALNPKP